MKLHTLLALICLSLLTPTLFGQTNTPADSTNAAPAVTNTITPFQQAVAKYQQPPNYFSDAEIVAKLSATMDTLPTIPEEARKHFVMGETEFKEAKSTNDFVQAAVEFCQASIIAPWWAETWNNMAVSRESAGDYDYALSSLKVYQDFKLSDEEARAAQDLGYKIQAEKDLAAKHVVDEQAIAAANAAAEGAKKKPFEDMAQFFQGAWNYTSYSSHYASHGGNPNSSGTTTITVTDDKKVTITLFVFVFKGTITGDDFASIHWVVSAKEHPEIPEFPINVTIDKVGSRISWRSPSIVYVNNTLSLSYDEFYDFQLTR